MKLLIKGQAYEMAGAIGEAALGDLYTLKVKLGISIKTINAAFERIGELAKVEGFNALDLLDEADIMLNLQGLIWLAKRHAGETLTLEEAGRFPFSALEFEVDEDDDEEEEAPAVDPKAPASEAADEPELPEETTT